MKIIKKMRRGLSIFLVLVVVLTLMPATPALAAVNPTSTLPNGQTGVAYSYQLTPTTGTAPYDFDALVVAGLGGAFRYANSENPTNLPKGLTLSATGLISGTPYMTGIYNFRVQATDNNLVVQTQDFQMTVTEGPNSVPGTNGEAYYDVAAPGGIITGRYIFGGPTPPAGTPAFLFEMEFPMSSLKGTPTWNELMQMLDNPYALSLDPSTGGTPQGYPSYRANIQRRPSFGVTLPRILAQPLNYNIITGEEMRLLNAFFPGATNFGGDPPYRLPVDVSPGGWTMVGGVPVEGPDARIEEGEPPVDYDIPFNSQINPTFPGWPWPANPGGDPGEPGVTDWLNPVTGIREGVINPLGYSLPALQQDPLDGQYRLYDPLRGFIYVRDPVTGYGINPTNGLADPDFATLSKPTVGKVEILPGRWVPDYTVNSAASLAAAAAAAGDDAANAPAYLTASNENDYVRNRAAAIALGKALFWDMQVGSDSVQSCGTCHFAAGADDRTKNQLNPNHLGGDLTFQLRQPNQDVVASDFPLHKVVDFNGDVPGDNENPANIISDVNDVMSSMGVKFGKFADIPTPGATAFGPAVNGVRSLLPDLRSPNAADNVDPIPGFAGADGSGHQFRRVEPRNTPTFFASAMNFDNFWDGRARHDFNGGSVFGASDPQSHVLVDPEGDASGNLTPTRQIIRYSSLASLATGPALSEFEMSFLGRNWQKIGKKLLQSGVTPLANQLVDPTDSVLGPYSGQRSSVGGPVNRPGRPGLNVSYPVLIRSAFYPQLWSNTQTHLNGTSTPPVTSALNGVVTPAGADPFDGYVLTLAAGAASPANTNQFTQMEANFSLFFGLGVSLWGSILIPDNTPLDQFIDANPEAFASIGEPGESGLVNPQAIVEVGNFKRDANQPLDPMNPTAGTTLTAPSVIGDTVLTVVSTAGFPASGSLFVQSEPAPVTYTGVTATTFTGIPAAGPGSLQFDHPANTPPFFGLGTMVSYFAPSAPRGTRLAGQPDPMLGFDLFFASNFSLKNPEFRSARCGECHLGATLTDHTVDASVQITRIDRLNEFVVPGVELAVEPLSRPRIISGFQLEGEVNENAQDTLERNIINQSVIPNPINGLAYPSGSAFIDNGVYNLGVTRTANDIGRGGLDPWGWPLSIAKLFFKNAGGPNFEPGVPLPNFNPALGPTGGLFTDMPQDQNINPGQEELVDPQLPPHLAPWIEIPPFGEGHPNADEQNFGLNTLTEEPMLEGFGDALGPFNPGGINAEVYNNNNDASMGTWPNVNRVLSDGAFKAPPLRNVELTGPYFHNGGKLTLRQVVDFYSRGGDFPFTNAAHRDFLIMNLTHESQSSLTETEKVALVDFLLELTDNRVRNEQAPFDRPEVFAPLDGTAPENTFSRAGFLANLSNGMFRQVTAVGAGGHPSTPLPSFLGISRTPVAGPNNDHYDH